MKKFITAGVLLFSAIVLSSFMLDNTNQQSPLNGAWKLQKGSEEIVWIFIDGYSVQTTYDKAAKRFVGTWGGPYSTNNGKLDIKTEFNTANSGMIGQTESINITLKDARLTTKLGSFTKLDDGTGALAGNWRISGRMQDGKMVESPRTARKTLKLLSGTRFQWVAINPDEKGFYGTGGGTYTFTNGKYTETIEFFSRDSTRVGASLTFDGKVENDAWTHSGLNSRGEQLHEVWRRERP
jgi:hypothetical protein